MEGLFVYAAAMPSIWKKVRLEILGPFTATAEGNRFLLFAVDPYTHWTEARAVPQSNPDTLARFVFSLFARLGRAELSVVGQKTDFCKQLAVSLQHLLRDQDSYCGMGVPLSAGEVTHGRHGAEQVYHLPSLPPDAGLTTGGMLLNSDSQIVCDQNDDLSPGQAALLAHSDPVNPVFRHAAFKRVARCLKQRTVNYTNVGSDLLNFVSSHMEDWDWKLDGYLYHIRTAVAVCSKGYSAFHLAHGRNPAPITGRELMMRSLRGIKEVMSLFSTADADKKLPSHPVRKEVPGVSVSSDKESNTPLAPSRSYHLRKRAKNESGNEKLADEVRGAANSTPVVLEAYSPSMSQISGPAAEVLQVQATGTAGSRILDKPGKFTPFSRTAHDDVPAASKSESLLPDAPARKRKPTNTDTGKGVRRGSRRRKRADILKVRCPTCPNTYVTSQEELQLHLECHAEDNCGDRIFKCPDCAKVCKIWLNMVRHMGHHRDISTFRKLPDECYKCKYCSKDFKVPECLREHVRVVHEGQKRFECHICHEKFKVYKTKMRHMDIKHANITYACDHCPYTTKVRRNLKLHAESHEKKDLKNRKVIVAEAGISQPVDQFTLSDTGPVFFTVADGVSHAATSNSQQPMGASQLSLFHRMQTMRPEQMPVEGMNTSGMSLHDHSVGRRDRTMPSATASSTEQSQIVYLSANGSLVASDGAPTGGPVPSALFALQIAGSGHASLLTGADLFGPQMGQNFNVSLGEQFIQSF